MVIDPNSSTLSDNTTAAAAIENELPTYRAISPGAIVSLVLGLGSVFCFTSLWFLLIVAASLVIGLLSIRKIRRLSDVLTGVNYGRAGIALALAFGLSALTHGVASDFLIGMEASRFARQFTEVIKDQPLNASLWYQQPEEYRLTKTPEEIAEEVKKSRNPMAPDMFADRTAGVQKIKERLKGPGEQIRFAGIESKAVDGLTVYANALIELDGPGSKEHPEKEEFALVEMVKHPGSGPTGWVVREIRFPYKPASTVATIQKAPDDGHGHSH